MTPLPCPADFAQKGGAPAAEPRARAVADHQKTPRLAL